MLLNLKSLSFLKLVGEYSGDAFMLLEELSGIEG